MNKKLNKLISLAKRFSELDHDEIIKFTRLEIECEKALKALEIINAIQPLAVFEDVGGKYHLITLVDEVGLTKDNYDLLYEVLE